MLQREIYLHSTIDHPHIIKLWDTIEEDNKIHMIMEYAENGTLFSYQNSHTKISELEAFRFFSQTLNAVRHLHSLDIMHRDLKVLLLQHSPKTYSSITVLTSKYATWDGQLTIFKPKGRPFAALISTWHLKWSLRKSIITLSTFGPWESCCLSYCMELLHSLQSRWKT